MADTQSKNKVKNKKSGSAQSTQLYLDVAEVRDDTVILKNGGLRAILQTSSINFNLKSEEEQNSIIYGYQNFLNSLDFPIQIVIQSRKLDVDKYIENIKEKNEAQQNQLLKDQALEYCSYIQKLVEYADIMEKKFYVIVPYDPYRIRNENMLKKFFNHLSSGDSIESIRRRHKEFEEMHKNLMERVSAVTVGLENCNLRVAQLSTANLIELFYQVYNPYTARNEKIEDLAKIDLLDF